MLGGRVVKMSKQQTLAQWSSQDRHWMGVALQWAARASLAQEVPIGCVIVSQQQLIAGAHNVRQQNGDPLGHSEMLALRLAAEQLGSWRMQHCTAYVTLEPCAMCAGALMQARMGTLVFAAGDDRAGAVGGCCDVVRASSTPHRMVVRQGLGAAAAGRLLRHFFQARRPNKLLGKLVRSRRLG